MGEFSNAMQQVRSALEIHLLLTDSVKIGADY